MSIDNHKWCTVRKYIEIDPSIWVPCIITLSLKSLKMLLQKYLHLVTFVISVLSAYSILYIEILREYAYFVSIDSKRHPTEFLEW